MGKPKTVYIIRHGETDYNKLGIVQGSGVDASLNDLGRAQANAFYEGYQHVGFQLLIASGLIRTKETIEPFVKTGLPLERHPNLNEISWGIHEGKKGEPWMRDSYLKINAAWTSGDFDARIEGGESAQELADRLQRFLETLAQKEEEKILVCSHGRAMCALICLMKGESLSEMHKVKSKNTALYIAHFDGKQYTFELESDVSHLAKIEEV